MRRVGVVETSCIDLARECDWAQTDLGPRESWPGVVEAAVRLLLEAPVPMCYCHGERFAMVYNDVSAALLGDRHPKSWAQPAADVLPELWDHPRVGPVLESVLRTGQPHFEDGNVPVAEDDVVARLLPDGPNFVRGYSPVRDDSGRVRGVLVVGVEDASGFSRLRTVASLASSLASAVSVDDVVKAALRHALHEIGVDEVTVCLPDRRTGGWRTTARRRTDVVSKDEERLPLIWSPADEDAEDAERRLVQVAETGKTGVEEEQQAPVVLPLGGAVAGGSIAYGLAGAPAPGVQAAMLTTCTELVAEALARARLYDTERSTADLLQRTLLPQLLPHRPGVSLAVRYQPVTTGTAAGGDFYDVFEVPDDRLAIVIGDVVGRGVAAATVMGQVRAAVRGAALAEPEPERVFHSLDRLVGTLDEVSSLRLGSYSQRSDDPLSLGVDGELFVTMLYCLLDPSTGRVTMASAGHFPPVLIRQGAGVEIADLPVGPPLGLPGERPLSFDELGEGDGLLAFTDGLLERRDSSLAEREAALLKTLSATESMEPRSICQQVIDQMVGNHHLEDDCALLALVRTNAVHHTASVVVPPLASAVRRTRTWVEGQLGSWEVDSEAVWVAVMGVSELVTNVLLHAATEARVTLDLSPERLLVTVADTGTRGAPTHTNGEVTATRGRGLGLVAAIANSCGFERNVSGSTVWFEVLVS
jgi:serine phosphatase RsbU (regulator of sigma subunit)/anti-sigma regulatory factor (Ser/Thr protein kinase)